MRSADLDFTGYLDGLERADCEPPTPRQERELLVRAQAGDTRARDELVTRNLRLVAKIALKWAYHDTNLPLSDLCQAGVIGLIRAIEKFDLSRKGKLSTYATPWITQAIGRENDNGRDTIRVPIHVAWRVRSAERTREELAGVLGRPPTADEVASELGLPAADVAELLAARWPTCSLDVTYSDDADATPLVENIADAIADTAEEAIDRVEAEGVWQMLEALPSPRDRDFIARRYGLNGYREHTHAELSTVYGITKAGSWQVEARALKRLREAA